MSPYLRAVGFPVDEEIVAFLCLASGNAADLFLFYATKSVSKSEVFLRRHTLLRPFPAYYPQKGRFPYLSWGRICFQLGNATSLFIAGTTERPSLSRSPPTCSNPLTAIFTIPR